MKIIIVQIGRIGDMVLTTPMFCAIKDKYPAAQIHVLSSKKASVMLNSNPYIEKIFIYQKGVSLLSLIIKLRREKYDIWIDPKDHYSSEGTILAKLSNAKNKIGYNRNGRKVFDVSLDSDEQNAGLHSIERNMLALKTLGIGKGTNNIPQVFIKDSIKKQVLSELNNVGQDIAVINISVGNISRKWDTDKWIEVVKYLETKKYYVILINDPKDKSETNIIFNNCPKIKIIDSPSIEYAMAAINCAKLIITPDTAIVHIASAFDIPIVALFPDITLNYNKFRPLSSKQVVIKPATGKEIKDIESSEVIEAIKNILI